MNITDIMESCFNVLYLIVMYGLVIKMSLILKGQTENTTMLKKFRNCFLLLALGDTGHVGFRVIAFMNGGLTANATLVGIGALCTAITVTIVYALIINMWKTRFDIKNKALYYGLLTVGIIRLIIMAFPQNEWNMVVPPFAWSLFRNIPLMIMGIGIAILILISAKKANDKTFTKFSYAIFTSYFFYTPVILFVQVVPMIGMLMIPKTLAYIVMAYIGYKDLFVPLTKK